MTVFLSDYTCNHLGIKNKGAGCSDTSYFRLIELLSNICDVTVCSSRRNSNEYVDNVLYTGVKYIEDNITRIDNVIQTRNYTEFKQYYELLKNTKLYIIVHDDIREDLIESVPDGVNDPRAVHMITQEFIQLYDFYKNINLVFVSKTQQEKYVRIFGEYGVKLQRSIVRYNLFPKYQHDISTPYEPGYRYILFASSLKKRLRQLVDKIYPILNTDLRLVVCHPSYSNDFDYPKREFVEYVGNLNGESYYNMLAGSQALIVGDFYETFGCVMAEANYVGRPVIYFDQSGAVGEICELGGVCLGNFYDRQPIVCERLESALDTLPNVNQNFQLKEDVILNMWESIL